MLIYRGIITGSVALLGLFAFSTSFAAPGIDIAAPAKGGVVPNIECNRTTCYYGNESQPSLNGLAAISAMNPTVVGPPAAQRYSWKPSGACIGVPRAATPGAPYEFLITEPVPVPLGSTHVSISGTAEAKLIGSGLSGFSTIFGRLEIRRSAIGSTPAGSWAISDYGYVFTRTGTSLTSARYGKATYIGFEDLSNLPSGSGVPDMIEVRLAVNANDGPNPGNWVYSTEPGDLPNPGICKGSLQLAF